MIILAIETSCDETGVAISKNGREILANVIYSQVDLHAIYGGVVPEIASRNHIIVLTKLVDEALKQAKLQKGDLDAIAVTYAPGLIGALLVGVNFAKSLAYGLGIPIIPVHHIHGHIAANYIAFPKLTPPFLCLVVSGGHSQIIDVRGYRDMHIIGTTRDDAAGECFDKIARVLGLGYPGGKAMDDLSQGGDDTAFSLPRSVIEDAPLDMSFSGLKTACVNIIHNAAQKNIPLDKAGLAASFAATVSDTFVPRVLMAVKKLGYHNVAVAGGVAANSRIRRDLERMAEKEGISLYLPPLSLCGDNAAMIACQAYYEPLPEAFANLDLNAFATKEISAHLAK